MRRFLLVSSAAATMVGAPVPAAGQDRPISGVVYDSLTGRPLEGASVYFTTVDGQVRTGADGRFQILGRSFRDSLLVVRRIGYVPRTVSITPHAPVLATVYIGSIYLRPVATELDHIAVEAEEVRRYPQLGGFYTRKTHLSGLGHFLTRDAIERRPVIRTSDLLRYTHKVEVECSKQSGGQCIATSRRNRETRLLQQRTRTDTTNLEEITEGFGMGRCRMDVWLDGAPSPFDIDAIPVHWIVGVEIYSGPATTPPVFGMGACGVVAIWTAVPGA